jgi:cold shock CspA family protein
MVVGRLLYRCQIGLTYGFIQPQAGDKDIFVHISAVQRAGLNGLNEGQAVEYERSLQPGAELGREPQSAALSFAAGSTPRPVRAGSSVDGSNAS